ncbi:prepilin-type N-terminal cleavage/methylation domain-containing protein [Pseudodesulfovibrio senegalensis]|jgi:prepilin-type N-terminal cleavage/methylation domain-containing protein|uniref:Prepilin-type N-terminal cleavage/methylation domain-containing protein n=1 Tax=Pseudodesulfovibrio senegalensis TaxID=1721087 RepID=A0A6N6N2A5_9BACT|nr:prepilin-type N-terminal cleavage/methylation domain-containing protein [Pseudodesulfovibrio senegalensis]KAB1441545.1 prepilin-type N-terminal cleavage/methylation domain-containing protein [Pseudodesulfovibrio senegalensis]
MNSKGFTLIEVLVSLVILSFVGMVAGYYYVEGIRGFSVARITSEVVPKASIALERMNIELSDCDDRSATGDILVQSDRIIYETTVTALDNVRTLRYYSSNGTIYLNPGDGTGEHLLLDDLGNCTMSADTADLDGSGGDEISALNISLSMDLGNGDSTTYSLRVMPRNFVHLAP